MPISFFVTDDARRERPRGGVVRVALERDRLGGNPKRRWDDYDYKTTFKVYLAQSGKPFSELGEWKILQRTHDGRRDIKVTELPERFDRLPDRFLSLGQDIAHYESLAADVDREIARAILEGLRDIVFVEPESEWQKLEGFRKSIVRFTAAIDAWVRGPSVLAAHGVIERAPTAEADLRIEFICPLAGFAAPHRLVVEFSNSTDGLELQRMWALVGRNGTGKTRLLGELARDVSGLGRGRTRLSTRPSFSRVIALSYSAWDNFPRPRLEGLPIAYVYGGLRERETDSEQLRLDVVGARRIATDDLDACWSEPARKALWKEAMHECGLDRESSPLGSVIRTKRNFAGALEKCSAGEQVAAIVLTRLVAHLTPRTLVLFDEPELHMHPNLLSGLLRGLHRLLVKYDSFALLATHSPLPLQEIPSACVRVVELVDDLPSIHGLDVQSFGASLGEIVKAAFPPDRSERNFASFIKSALKTTSREGVLAALGDDPSTGVDLLLSALEKSGHEFA